MDLVVPMRGQDSGYMQELVNWYRFDEMGDLDIQELDELKDELVALNALDFMEGGKEDVEVDLGAVDVMQIFSPPRFTEAAKRHGLRPGVAVDLSTCRPSDGVGWDLLRKEDQSELGDIIEGDQPWLLTGSPRCDPFSQLQYLNRTTTDEKGVYYAQGPMCRCGLQLPEKYRDESDGVPEYVRKESGFVTNSEEIWHELNGKCSNLVGGDLHRRTELKGGVAHFAAKCPPRFVSAALRALRRQLKKDGGLNAVEEIAGPVPEMPTEYKEMLESGGGFWDDVNGGFLPTDKVLAARQGGISWIHGEGVYDIVPEQEARDAGVRPLDVLWVDTDKSMDPNEQKIRLVYVELPAEDRPRYGEKMLGRLVKSMYGTQDASHLWQLDYVDLCPSSEGGFKRGKHNAALFFNPAGDIRMAVHGGDFVVLSDVDGLEHVDRLLSPKYPSKMMGTLGFDEGDYESLQLLNRIVRRGKDTRGEYIEIEPDPRHAKMILAETGCTEATKSVSTPREKLKDTTILEGIKGKKLIASETTRYRSVCMRLSYLAQDRLDLVESAKTSAQRMAGPTEQTGSFDPVPMQAPVSKIEVYVDSDFAGDPITRKSTTGLVAMVGSHVIKGSSTLQSLTSLSVGEAEFYAVVNGGAVALMLKAIYEDFGDHMEALVLSDSTTAGSLADRLGVGQRTKHIQTRFLWVQERVQDRDLKVQKVHTSKNLADLATKPVSGVLLDRHVNPRGSFLIEVTRIAALHYRG
ncbi:unnamed protein product, partial [Prorocentrum cordatum]